jgi:hypothetical protein
LQEEKLACPGVQHIQDLCSSMDAVAVVETTATASIEVAVVETQKDYVQKIRIYETTFRKLVTWQCIIINTGKNICVKQTFFKLFIISQNYIRFYKLICFDSI